GPADRDGSAPEWLRVSWAHAPFAFAGEGLSGMFLQRGLGIEGVDMAGSAAHEQRDHTLGARLEMRRLRCVRIVSEGLGVTRCGEQSVLVEKMSQRQSADTAARPEQKIAPPPDGLHKLTARTEIR